MIDMWQTTNLDRAVAEEFFGWKWMAFNGTPIRSHPEYPTKMRVREFMRPSQMAHPQWVDFFARADGREADGTEPLSYSYCSSNGETVVPHFSGHADAIADLEKELRKRNLWSKYREQLWAQIGGEGDIDESALADADYEERCVAALAIVGSKHVVMDDPPEED